MKSLSTLGLALLLACGPISPVRAQDAPARPVGVSAKVGIHPRYISVVMHWQGQVHADGNVAKDVATIVFDTPAKLDLAALNDALPENLRPAKLSADRTTLTLPIPDQAELRIHNRGALLYFDVLLPPVIHNFAELPADEPVPVAPKPVATAEAPKPVPVPVEAAPAPKFAEAAPQPAPAVSPPPPAPAPPQELTVHHTALDDGVSYRFDWQNPAAAAIFARGGVAWIVFDRPQIVKPDVPGLTQIANPGATVLRFDLTNADHLQVGHIGTAWMVDLRHGKESAVPSGIAASGNFYQTPAPSHPVTIADPVSGGLLIAVPSGEYGQHLAQSEDRGAYFAVATIQGLAFQLKDETLPIGIGPTGVTLGKAASHD